MNAQRRAYCPYRGRYLTPDEAWKAAWNPLIWKQVEWQDDPIDPDEVES